MLRERDFHALMMKHVETGGTEVGRLEAIGAINFLALDDVLVAEEGEPVDPRSVIALPFEDGRPALPEFKRTPNDRFLCRIDSSGKKWVIITDPAGAPQLVLDTHHFLRTMLFEQASVRPEAYWHRPIIVTDMHTRLGEVIGRMPVDPENPEDDVIDNDLILVWSDDRRVITGADLLGRLLRGIATRPSMPQREKDAGMVGEPAAH